MAEFGTLVLPVIAGAIAGLLASFVHSFYWDRRRRSLDLATEYLGEAFITHRLAVYQLTETIADSNNVEVTAESVARGFWFPGRGDPYLGEHSGNLSQHQHLEIVLSWYRRVGFAITKRLIDVKSLRAQLGGTLDWSAALIRGVCDEIEAQAGDETPDWVEFVKLAQDRLVANECALELSASELRKRSSETD